MEPLDATFVDAFLGFLNDKTADARRAEKGFSDHPYAARLGIFKASLELKDYRHLHDSAKRTLERILKSVFSNSDRTAMAESLNASQFDGYIIVGSTQIKGETKNILKSVRIGAVIEYEVIHRRIVTRVYPTISGMQQGCAFALMLISNEPHRVKRCRLAGCGKFFNSQTSGQRFFCTKNHALDHERKSKIVRADKSRRQTT